MISVNLKENETVDRALKRFKKKFEKAGIVKQLRERQQFEKPSVLNKKMRERAAYRQQLFAKENY